MRTVQYWSRFDQRPTHLVVALNFLLFLDFDFRLLRFRRSRSRRYGSIGAIICSTIRFPFSDRSERRSSFLRTDMREKCRLLGVGEGEEKLLALRPCVFSFDLPFGELPLQLAREQSRIVDFPAE